MEIIACWMTDPVHETKSGYAKLATRLVERLDRESAPQAEPPKATPNKKRNQSPTTDSVCARGGTGYLGGESRGS